MGTSLVAQCICYSICCTMCLVFYMLLDKFDILWVAQLGAVMLLDQVNRQLSLLHTGHSDV